MHRALVRLRLLGSVVGLILALGLVGLHTAPARRLVTNRLAAVLAARHIAFSAEPIRYNLLDGSVTLRDVRIGSAIWRDAPVFATIGRARFDLNLFQLLRGRYVIQSGQVEDVALHYLVDDRGRDNLPHSSIGGGAQRTSLDYFVSSFSIARVQARYEDRRRRIDIRLPIDSIEVTGNERTHEHLVRFDASGGDVRTGDSQATVHRVHGQADVGHDAVSIEQLNVDALGSRLEVTGTITQLDSPVIDLMMASQVDSAELASFAGLKEPINGSLTIAATAKGSWSAPVVTMQASGPALRFRDLRDFQVDATGVADLTTRIADVSSLQVRAPYGQITARTRVSFNDSDLSTIEATIADVDSATVMRALRVPLHVATQVNGTLQADWRGMDYLAARGTASVAFRSTHSNTAQPGMPLDGHLEARANDGRVEGDLGLAVPGADFTGRVELTSDHQLGGGVTGRSTNVNQLIASIGSLRGRPLGSPSDTPISGGVAFDARLSGSLDAPIATATLKAPALAIGNVSRIALDAETSYAARTVTITRSEVMWNKGHARIDGHIGLEPDQPIALSLTVEEMSIDALLQAINGPRRAIAGTVAAKGAMQGTLAHPTAVFTAESTNLAAYGEALGSLRLDARLDGDELTFSKLIIDKPQDGQPGQLTANGTYNLKQRTFTAEAQSDGLQLLGVTLPGGPRVRGNVRHLSARGAGSIDLPEGSIDVDFAALEIETSDRTTPLGRVVVNGVAKHGEATITAAAERFSLDARAVVGMIRPWPATLSLRADDLDLSTLPVHPALATTPETLGDLQGSLRASLEASGDLQDPAQGQAALALESLAGMWNGRPFTVTSAAPLRYANERLAIDGLRVEGLDTSLSLSGELPVSDPTASGEIAVDLHGSLATLAQYAPRETGLSADGAVTLTGSVRGTLTRFDPDLTLTVDEGVFVSPQFHPGLSNLVVRARIDEGAATIQQFDAHWGTATIQASGRIPLDVVPQLPAYLSQASGPATLKAVVGGLDPSSIPGAPPQLGGRLSAEAALTASRADLNALVGRISFQEVDLKFGGLDLAQQQPVTIALTSGTATIEQFMMSGSAGTMTVGGRVALQGERAVDLSIDGTLNIAALSILTDRIRTEGHSTVKLAARGPLSAPELTGTIDLTDGIAISTEPRIAAENINARLDLIGRRISVTRFDADVNGGTVSASGMVTLGERVIRDVDLSISAKEVAYDEPLGLRSLSNASLQITRAGETILVKGKVTIDEAGLTDDINLDAGALARLGARRERDLTQTPATPLLDRVRFDISIATAMPMIVENNLGRGEITADLHLVGTPGAPGLLGSMTVLEESEIRLNERRYQVERGVITFADERRIVPSLDLRLNARANDYDITVTVTGTPGHTETMLTSVPSLPEPDIMAMLVTGRTLDEMRGEEFEVAREQVLSTLAGRAGSTLGRGLQHATGFSEVRIEPILIANEADPSARLTIGQNLTSELKAVYSTNLADSNDQIWVLEYDLTRRFQARAVWQEDDSSRFEFRRSLRLGGRPEPAASERVRPTIREVSVTVDDGDEAEVRDRFGIKVGAPYDFFEIRQRIQRVREWLIDQGYLQSRIRLQREVEGQNAHLQLHVVRGPHVEITVMGASPPKHVERALREQWQRGAFDQQRAGDAEDTLREWLMDDNYLRAKVSHTIEDTAKGREVVFQIEPGEHSRRIVMVFDGASAIQPGELARVVHANKLERQLLTNPSAVIDVLEGHYRTRGYLSAQVNEPRFEFQDETARIVLPVVEGPRFVVGSIAMSGNTVLDTGELVSQLPLVAGAAFVPAAAENALAKVRDLYWARGYNDVAVDYELVTNRIAGEVDVTFSIVEGHQNVIADITIEGNERVSDHLVRAQMQLSPEEPLDLGALARSRRRLYGTGAFSFVDINRRQLQDGNDTPPKRVDLDVALKEVPPFQLRYGASYDTERGFGGILDVTNRNSLGGARELGLRSRYDGEVTDIRLYVNQPELTYRYETTASLYYREELNPPTDLTDPFETNRKGGSIQQQRKLRNKYLWMYGYKYERAHTLTPTPTGTIDEAVTVSPLTTTLTREARDVILDAARGSFLSQALSFSPSWLGSDQPYVKYYGQYFRYFPLQAERQDPVTGESIRPRLVFASGVRLGLAWGLGNPVPRTERFFAGGSATMRGFEQNTVGPITPERFAVGGEALLVLNNEIRMPLVSIFDGVVFTDIGNVFDKVSNFSITNLRQSAGVGLRVRTSWLLLRADYGVVIDRRPGEPRGELYISIGQAF